MKNEATILIIGILLLMAIAMWLALSLSKCGKELKKCGEEGLELCNKLNEPVNGQ